MKGVEALEVLFQDAQTKIRSRRDHMDGNATQFGYPRLTDSPE